MKRILVFLLSIFLGLALNAQGHMTFQNIPIEGKLSAFIPKMEKAGFSMEESLPNGAFMSGTLDEVGECLILVLCSHESKTVWKVVVFLPLEESWSKLLSSYNDIKAMLQKAYGDPSDFYEEFNEPYNKEGYELQALKIEEGYYATLWELAEGKIQVSISAVSSSKGRVEYGYEDAEGILIHRRESGETATD